MSSHNEFYSDYYVFFSRLLHRMTEKGHTKEENIVGRKELLAWINEIGRTLELDMPRSFLDAILGNDDESLSLLQYSTEAKGYYFEKGFEIPSITKLEAEWLNLILSDQRSAYFVDEELSEKIIGKTKSMPISEMVSFQMPKGDKSKADMMKGSLSHVQSCIDSDAMISYNYITNTGLEIQGTSKPLGMEYSVRDDLVYLIHYNTIEERPIKSLMSRMTFKIGENPVQGECSVNMEEAMKSHKSDQSLRIRVKDERASLERAAMLFSEYKKQMFECDGHYIIQIDYYDFEKEMLLIKCMSLGAFVEVLSPEDFRNEIRSRIKSCVDTGVNYSNEES